MTDNNNWDIIDTNIIKEFRNEIKELKLFIYKIEKRNDEIMHYLESNRKLYSKMIKDNFELTNIVKQLLEENRKLYMGEFKKEDKKLSKLEKITEKHDSVSLIREANKQWRKNSTPSILNTLTSLKGDKSL